MTFVRKFTVMYLLRHLIKIGETFLNMAFSKEDILFEDEFDAVMTLIYTYLLKHDKEMLSEMASIFEKITSARKP